MAIWTETTLKMWNKTQWIYEELYISFRRWSDHGLVYLYQLFRCDSSEKVVICYVKMFLMRVLVINSTSLQVKSTWV